MGRGGKPTVSVAGVSFDYLSASTAVINLCETGHLHPGARSTECIIRGVARGITLPSLGTNPTSYAVHFEDSNMSFDGFMTPSGWSVPCDPGKYNDVEIRAVDRMSALKWIDYSPESHATFSRGKVSLQAVVDAMCSLVNLTSCQLPEDGYFMGDCLLPDDEKEDTGDDIVYRDCLSVLQEIGILFGVTFMQSGTSLVMKVDAPGQGLGGTNMGVDKACGLMESYSRIVIKANGSAPVIIPDIFEHDEDNITWITPYKVGEYWYSYTNNIVLDNSSFPSPSNAQYHARVKAKDIDDVQTLIQLVGQPEEWSENTGLVIRGAAYFDNDKLKFCPFTISELEIKVVCTASIWGDQERYINNVDTDYGRKRYTLLLFRSDTADGTKTLIEPTNVKKTGTGWITITTTYKNLQPGFYSYEFGLVTQEGYDISFRSVTITDKTKNRTFLASARSGIGRTLQYDCRLVSFGQTDGHIELNSRESVLDYASDMSNHISYQATFDGGFTPTQSDLISASYDSFTGRSTIKVIV